MIILAAVLVWGLFVGQTLANDFLAETQDYNAGIILKQQVAVMPNPNIIPPMLYPIFLEKSEFFYPMDGNHLFRIRLYKPSVNVIDGNRKFIIYYFRESWYSQKNEEWIDKESGWYNPRDHALYDLNLWGRGDGPILIKGNGVSRIMTSDEKETLVKRYDEFLSLYQKEPGKFLSENELPLQ